MLQKLKLTPVSSKYGELVLHAVVTTCCSQYSEVFVPVVSRVDWALTFVRAKGTMLGT